MQCILSHRASGVCLVNYGTTCTTMPARNLCLLTKALHDQFELDVVRCVFGVHLVTSVRSKWTSCIIVYKCEHDRNACVCESVRLRCEQLLNVFECVYAEQLHSTQCHVSSGQDNDTVQDQLNYCDNDDVHHRTLPTFERFEQFFVHRVLALNSCNEEWLSVLDSIEGFVGAMLVDQQTTDIILKRVNEQHSLHSMIHTNGGLWERIRRITGEQQSSLVANINSSNCVSDQVVTSDCVGSAVLPGEVMYNSPGVTNSLPPRPTITATPKDEVHMRCECLSIDILAVRLQVGRRQCTLVVYRHRAHCTDSSSNKSRAFANVADVVCVSDLDEAFSKVVGITVDIIRSTYPQECTNIPTVVTTRNIQLFRSDSTVVQRVIPNPAPPPPPQQQQQVPVPPRSDSGGKLANQRTFKGRRFRKRQHQPQKMAS